MIKVNGIGFEVSQIHFAAHYALKHWRANGRVVLWFDAARRETYREYGPDFDWKESEIFGWFEHVGLLAASGARDV